MQTPTSEEVRYEAENPLSSIQQDLLMAKGKDFNECVRVENTGHGFYYPDFLHGQQKLDYEMQMGSLKN